MIICWAEDWGGLVLRLFQVGHCNFGLGLGLVVLCWYIHIFNILDRDVFSPRREKSAPQNLHTTCIDNGSNNGVLKCKFRLPELSNSGTNIKYVSWSCIDLDLIIFLKYNSWLFLARHTICVCQSNLRNVFYILFFLGHFQMLQTDSRLDRGNLDPRQETWSTGLSSIWRHVSWSYPLHTCW